MATYQDMPLENIKQVKECYGVEMAEGLQENDQFPLPIITPSTKAENGEHDEDISREDILAKGIVSEKEYLILEDYTRKLFQRGTEIAAERGLILVDTKYEFGKTKEGKNSAYRRNSHTRLFKIFLPRRL